MSSTGVEPTNRVATIVYDIVRQLEEIIEKYKVTEDEYRRAMQYLAEVGRAGEMHVLIDTFLNVKVDQVNYPMVPNATESNILGPYYLPNAPLLDPPYRLGRRPNEPGDRLYFSGTVTSTDGTPLGGTLLDIWQASADGNYDHRDPEQPDFNFRGRLFTDENGRFEFETVVPGQYELRTGGPVRELLDVLNQGAFRPGHIHFKVTHEGFHPLTTQVYFEGDPYLEEEAVMGAFKPSLLVSLEKHDDPEEFRSRGVDTPFFTGSFNFRVVPTSA